MDETMQSMLGMMLGVTFAMLITMLFFVMKDRRTHPIAMFLVMAVLSAAFIKGLFVMDEIFFKQDRLAARAAMTKESI